MNKMTTQTIFVLAVLIFFIACSPSKSIDSDFNKCMEIVDDYDTYRGHITDTILARFFFATEYLERITGVEANYVFAEPPHYQTRSDCKSDLRKWRKWYDNHIDYVTQERSDSLMQEIAKDNIGWSDTTILEYVFSK
jgi:hypothetical protein